MSSAKYSNNNNSNISGAANDQLQDSITSVNNEIKEVNAEIKQVNVKIDQMEKEQREVETSIESAIDDKTIHKLQTKLEKLTAKEQMLRAEKQQLTTRDQQLRAEKQQLLQQQTILMESQLRSNSNNSNNSTPAYVNKLIDKVDGVERTLKELNINQLSTMISPPSTPAVVAEQTLQRLGKRDYSVWDAAAKNKLQSPPILTVEQHAAIVTDCKTSEALLVARITPFLAPLINREYRVLVNSETKPWIETLRGHSKYRGKPDLWVGPYYAVRPLRSTQYKDEELAGKINTLLSQNPSSYLYGEPYHGTDRGKADLWYDSIMPIAAKLNFDNNALGEAINYTYWFSQSPIQPSTRGMLITLDKFYLLHSTKGVVTSITEAKWTDAGSAELMADHFSFDSPWTQAVRELCQKFNVTPLRFLGAGSNGRVFEVIDNSSNRCRRALKVALGSRCGPLAEKIPLAEKEQILIRWLIEKKPEIVSVLPQSISDFHTLYTDVAQQLPWAGGYLLSPVGESINVKSILQEQNGLSDLLQSLRLMHRNGVVHGDPRLPNILRRQRVTISSSSSTSPEPHPLSPYRPYHQYSYSATSASSIIDIDHDISANSGGDEKQHNENNRGIFFVDFMYSVWSFSNFLDKSQFTTDLCLFIGYLIAQKTEVLMKDDRFKELCDDYYSALSDDALSLSVIQSLSQFVCTKQQRR